MILEDALSQLRIPILWSTFRDMSKEAFLEIQSLEHGGTPTSSDEEEVREEEEEEAEEEEEVGIDKEEEEE